MGHREHQQQAQSTTATVRCGIITISDTRTHATDTSGATIRDALIQAGHNVVRYDLVHDEPEQIITLVQDAIRAECQVVITNGGTGVARRDTTFEAIDSLLTKHLPGFGELFRMLSFNDIGPAAMLSRATAGVIEDRTLVFCLPGSPGAVQLALDTLIIPALPHLVWETLR